MICAKNGCVEMVKLQAGYKVTAGLMLVGEYASWEEACKVWIEMVSITNR